MTPEAKVMNARMKLRKEKPYLGDVLLYLQPKFDDAISTMGVDMNGRLTVSPTWVETLKPEQVIAIIIHELLHILLMHPYRDPPEVMAARHGGEPTADVIRKHRLANIACDLKINFMCHDIGCQSDLPPCGVLPDKFGTFSFKVGTKIHYIKDIGAKSVERLYRELLDIDDETDGGASGIKSLDNHEGWAQANPQVSDQTVKQRAGDWMVRAAGLLSAHKSKGTLPENLIRELELLLTPVMDWRGKLQRFVQPIVAMETSYRRIRRTSWAIGVILPGRSGEGVHIVAHVDTSGSMKKPELEQITAELYGILDSYPHVRITLLHSNAGPPQVLELRETDRDSILELVKLTGGGGTSHRPVVTWVNNNMEEMTQAIICFTDGLSDIQSCFGDMPNNIYRMLVLTHEDQIEKLRDHCEETAYLPVA